MKYKVGLALSGGGVKGAVHAGMIHYFDENGFKPDVICGSSSGAIVGALYANGLTGKEIFDFFLNERPFSKSLWAGSRGLINTPALRELFEKYIPHNRFEALQIKLITTATNMMTGNGETFQAGSLIDKVLASASFPGVFSPMMINDFLYSDGGVVNNFPVDIIRNKCHYVIGMYLSPNKELDISKLSSTKDILARSVDIQGSQAEYNKLKQCDIGMCPMELVEYSSFDFDKEKLNALFQLGYNNMKSKAIELNKIATSH
ncbi:MAG: patatin-like phospholipase family protein [Salibacteraceae bacterium]